MVCKNCGNVVDNESKFCPVCGSKISDQIFCEYCGTKLSKSVKFCPNCGSQNLNYDKNAKEEEESSSAQNTYSNSNTYEYNGTNTVESSQGKESGALAICALIFGLLGGFLGILLGIIGLSKYKTSAYRTMCWIGVIASTVEIVLFIFSNLVR